MIDVEVLSTVRKPIDAKLLRRAAEAALRGRLKRAVVSVVVVGARRMRTWNRDALGHDYVTDVLSFDHGDSPEGRQCEVIICPDFAAAMARRHGLPLSQELARYVVHGCLHFAGMDDVTPKQRAAMWQVQESILRKLFGRRYIAQPVN